MKFPEKNCYFSDVLKFCKELAGGPANLSKSLGMVSVTALALGFGLSACSDSTNTAGGGPSGTEAGNAITAQILTADKTPAVQAQVKLVHSESLDAEKESYSATTDENGVVTIEGIAKGDYILEASQGATALQQKVYMDSGKVDVGSSHLEKTVSVSGEVDTDGIIKVRGLDHAAEVVNGKFLIDSLPAGHLDLVFIPNSEDADTVSSYLLVAAGKKATASTFATERNTLLLDDFEDGDNQHRFAPLYFGPSDGGWWYVSHGPTVLVPTMTVADSGAEVLSLTKEDNGNGVLHAIFDFDSLQANNLDSAGRHIQWPWANLGVALGSNDKSICYDLTSADSVVFKARGSGSFNFILADESHKSDTFDGKFAESSFTLLEEWTRYSIPLSNIVDERLGSLNCVTLLTWAALNTSEIWLDDVELIGADRNSIWKSGTWTK